MRESENGANGAVDDETSESDPEGEGGEVGNTHRTLTIQITNTTLNIQKTIYWSLNIELQSADAPGGPPS